MLTVLALKNNVYRVLVQKLFHVEKRAGDVLLNVLSSLHKLLQHIL